MRHVRIAICLILWASSAMAAHLDGVSHNNIAYLLNTNPNTLYRFDMNTRQWMSNISLPVTEAPTAIAVNDSGIYIGYGRVIYRYDLDGNNQAHVANRSTSVLELLTVGDFLVISESGSTTVLNLQTSAVTGTLSSYDQYYLRTGLSAADNMLRVFGRSTGISPPDIGYMQIGASGTITSSGDSPHHGDYPSASKTWVFPDETKVVDNAGIIYSSQSLSYLGSFAGSFDLLTFVGDIAVLLRGNELIAYTSSLLESGSYLFAMTDIDEIFSDDQSIFAFSENSSDGYDVQAVFLSEFSTAQPGEPINPTNLAYTPDADAYDPDDGIIFLLSKLHANIFRWSISEKRYLESIPLQGIPEYMSVDTDSNIIYLAYKSGKINKIELGSLELAEQHFASLPQAPLGLAQVEQFVFAVDASGAWESHYTYHPDGSLISAVDWNTYSREFTWSRINQKIYHFRDGTSPNDLLWEEINAATGEIGDQRDSPYHSSAGILLPIRVSPDGSVVLLGSGRIYDATSLDQINTLSNDIMDAVWIDGSLVTLEADSSFTIIQRWGSTYSLDTELLLSGEPLRIYAVDSQLLLIRSLAGVPTFDLFDLDNLPDDDGDGASNFIDLAPLDPSIGTEANMIDFFPLEADMTWTHLINGFSNIVMTVLPETETIHDKITRIIESVDGSINRSSYSADDDGIILHKEFLPDTYVGGLGYVDITIEYHMGVKLIPKTVTQFEKSTSTAGTVSITYAGYGTLTLDYASASEVMGYEKVEVPYGSFNAFKIHHTLRLYDGESFDNTITRDIWLARDIGIVQSIASSEDASTLNVLSSAANLPDGVDAQIENGAPNNGDGNDDGYLDSTQDNVSSPQMGTGGNYITVDTPSFGSGAPLSYVKIYDRIGVEDDDGYELPHGAIGFQINGLPHGGTEMVRIYFHEVMDLSGYIYRYYDSFAKLWDTLPGVVYGTEFIDGKNVAYADLQLTDGGDGDADLSANGSIMVNPGGPARFRQCDLAMFAREFGRSDGSSYSACCCDIDDDGDVDMLDYK